VGAGALLWGTTGVAVRIIAQRCDLTAAPIGCLRAAVAAVLVALLLRGRAGPVVAALRQRPVRLLVCGAGFGAYQGLYFLGVQDVGVGVSTLVSLGIAPVALTIGAALHRRAVPSPGSLAVLTCAVGGLVLISLGSPSGLGPHPVLGILASVGSGLGYAGTTALSRRLADLDPLVVTGITSGVGAVLLLPLALVAGLSWPADAIASWWLVYIGMVPTVLAYWLFLRGLRTTSAEVAGVLTLLEPLAATFLAAGILHEPLTAAEIIGALLMLLAIGGLYLRPPDTTLPQGGEVPPP
jgi:DME family drug/metabolite transporter